jgi:hypothetical protein
MSSLNLKGEGRLQHERRLCEELMSGCDRVRDAYEVGMFEKEAGRAAAER